MDDDQGDVTQAAVQFGLVPLSPHVARVVALEAEVARLLMANAVLQRGAEIIAAADVPAIPAFPVRALTFGAQRIGLLVGPY
jgi:hypothetical protein